MSYSNLHTHTVFSDGVNTLEKMVLAALEQGFVSLGFSDHSFTPFDTSYCMREEVLPAYLRETRRLARKYEGQIEIYTGLEWDGFSELPDRAAFDYLIGDCHYVRVGEAYYSIDHDEADHKRTIRTQFGGDPLALARAYFDTYVSCQRKHRPDILGHFDLPVLYGCMPEESPVYRRMALEALLASLEVTPLLEVNTGAIAKKRRSEPYPAVFLLREALAHGAKFVLSSDAHKAANLHFYHDETAELLHSIGCREIVQLRKGRFEEVGI